MDEPMLRVWMQELRRRRRSCYAERPGPLGGRGRLAVAARSSRGDWRLDLTGRDGGASARADRRPRGRAPRIRGVADSAGLDAGAWCPTASRATGPATSAPRTAELVTFASAPLAEPARDPRLPRGRAALASDRPQALVVRAPVRGVPRRRLAARHPRVLEPDPPRRATSIPRRSSPASVHGRRSRSTRSRTRSGRAPHPRGHLADLLAVGVAVARAGHADAVAGGASTLDLPVRPPRPGDAALPPFAAAETPPGLGERTVGGGPGSRSYVRDLVDGSLTWDVPVRRRRQRRPPQRLGGRGVEPGQLLHPRGRPAVGHGARAHRDRSTPRAAGPFPHRPARGR